MTAEPPAWQLWETCSPGRPCLSHTHSTSISIFALSFFLSGLFLFIPDVCFIPPALICSHVSRCSPGWIHKGLIARDVSLSVFPSISFQALVSSQLSTFRPLILSVLPPACLSVILTFTLCLSVPVSLSPPLYFFAFITALFSLLRWVLIAPIYFFPQPFFLSLLSSSLPHISLSPISTPGPNQTTHHLPPLPSAKKKVVSTRTQHKAKLFFFSFLDHSAVTMLLTLSRAIFRSVRGDTLHSYHTTDSLGIRLSNMNDDTYHEMIERTLLLCYRQPFNIYEYNGLWLQAMMSII